MQTERRYLSQQIQMGNKLERQLGQCTQNIESMQEYIYAHLTIASRLKGIDDEISAIEMKEEDWVELEVFLNMTSNGFVKRFNLLHPKAKAEILRFCMLLRLGLSNKQISVVYHIAERSVKQKAYQFKEQLTGVPAELSLRKYIQSFR